MKKTIVLGASPNPSRFAHQTVKSMVRHGIEVIPIGIKHGSISNVEIVLDKPELENIHTISIYLNPKHQTEYYDYIIDLSPNRIIFNPGAENQELSKLAEDNNIQVLNACTIVMLNNGTY